MGAPFEAGDRALLVDDRVGGSLVRLERGGTFHYHGGAVPHDLILDSEEERWSISTTGSDLTCLRPRMADFVLKMPRGAQVIYPKDVGAILVYADIGLGVRVLEAGTGSGALTFALCRATGPEGLVVSYEVRPTSTERRWRTWRRSSARCPRGSTSGRATSGRLPGRDRFDRVVLDLPSHGRCWIRSRRPCGAGHPLYLSAHTNQVQSAVLGMERSGYAGGRDTRGPGPVLHVTERSVRPDHRMVAHTGFVTVAERRTTTPKVSHPRTETLS